MLANIFAAVDATVGINIPDTIAGRTTSTEETR